MIHVDIWGSYSIPSIHSYKYFLTIVDDYSSYIWIFLLKQESEVVKILKNFVVFVQTQFETTIKIIKSNNGTEFFLTNFFVNKGIVHQISCVNTPQQNNIVERKYDHLLNITALIYQKFIGHILLYMLRIL